LALNSSAAGDLSLLEIHRHVAGVETIALGPADPDRAGHLNFLLVDIVMGKVGDKRGIAINLCIAAEVALRRGENDLADDRLRQAEALANKVHDLPVQAHIKLVDGMVAAACGNQDRAEARYLASLAIANKVGIRREMAQAQELLGRLLVERQELMEGRQKLFYLPEPHTDFIFANIAEELGLLGAVLIIALFITLGYRGLRTASLSKDPFARFLAFGITATILIQAFFNVSVVLALVPTKGITLPFVSYGGTSLFFTLASVGVLLNLSRETD